MLLGVGPVVTELRADALRNGIGGKARGLAIAMSVGARVPPTILIHADSLTTGSDGTYRALASEIAQWARRLKLRHVIVRSWATPEDSETQSFASIFVSSFSSTSIKSISGALNEVAASSASTVVAAYSKAMNVDGPFNLGCLVQPTVPARASGVAFYSRDATTTRLVVQGTWGLSCDMVQGLSRGDVHDSSRPAEEIFDVASKPMAIYPFPRDEPVPGDYWAVPTVDSHEGEFVPAKILHVDHDQALVYVRLPESTANAPCFSQSTVNCLRRIADALASQYPMGVDIEWVEDPNGRLWLVQARPITQELPNPSATRKKPALGSSNRSEGAPQVVYGEPASPGRFRGRLVSAEWFSGYPDPGAAVLACGAANTDLVPAIIAAGAIASSDAGVLSHIAIIARELGKPCVLGVYDLTRRIEDGSYVEVDGATGRISAISEKERREHKASIVDDSRLISLHEWPRQVESQIDRDACVVVVMSEGWRRYLEKQGEEALRLLEGHPKVLFLAPRTDDTDRWWKVLIQHGFEKYEHRRWIAAGRGCGFDAVGRYLDPEWERSDA